MKLLDTFKNDFTETLNTYSLNEYLELCKSDSFTFASPAERLLKAIGEPKIIHTQSDPKLSRIFSNKTLKIYEKFGDFYGLEETLEKIVNYLKFSAQGLEESKAILYLLGPVGSSKSSIVERMKELIEQEPVYIIKGSPVFESPLGLFNHARYHSAMESEYHIPKFALRTFASPWAIQKLKEFEGDVTKFEVEKVYPSRINQRCVAKVEPGDENNQDISTLVGKVDIRQLAEYPQNHPYAYSYSGGLCRANQGVLDFVEMFKAPLKMLHPLLTATQERNYNGTEAIASIPFDGIIIAHSNEQEWQSFKSNKTNEAFIDRISLITVPYCLRSSEEIKIYKKLLRNSALKEAPCAPHTLNMLAEFCVLSRLKTPENSTLFSKMQIYDGENIKDKDPKAKTIHEYQNEAGVTEGMSGISTRFAFKTLSKVFNYDTEEVSANPIHLMSLLKTSIQQEQFSKEYEDKLYNLLDGTIKEKYIEFLEKEIRKASIAAYAELCQRIFDRYFYWADAWLNDNEVKDPDTNLQMNKEAINEELEKIEKTGLNVSNPKEFRYELVNYVIRYRGNHKGENPKWDSFTKMRETIERSVIDNTESLLPIISFSPKTSEEDTKKHENFVKAMGELGYTPRQTRLVAEWFIRIRKAN